MAIIMDCNCKSDYQDMTYGKGKRVFNGTPSGATCTVCRKKTAGAGAVAKDAKKDKNTKKETK